MQYLRIHIVLAGAAHFVVHVRRDFNRALLLQISERELSLVVASSAVQRIVCILFVWIFDCLLLFQARYSVAAVHVCVAIFRIHDSSHYCVLPLDRDNWLLCMLLVRAHHLWFHQSGIVSTR